jgi:DNA repair exonuclease SbcCD ATPase subunit
MKLAEALLERKGAKTKIDNLQERLEENALVQAGDTPAEAPESLVAELRDALARLESLIRQINAANNTARLPSGVSVSEAIVRRDMLKLERQALERMVAAMSTRHLRFGRNEVKFVATIGQAKVRQEIDRLSKEWRELDAQIQAVNWLTEVRAGE